MQIFLHYRHSYHHASTTLVIPRHCSKKESEELRFTLGHLEREWVFVSALKFKLVSILNGSRSPLFLLLIWFLKSTFQWICIRDSSADIQREICMAHLWQRSRPLERSFQTRTGTLQLEYRRCFKDIDIVSQEKNEIMAILSWSVTALVKHLPDCGKDG